MEQKDIAPIKPLPSDLEHRICEHFERHTCPGHLFSNLDRSRQVVDRTTEILDGLEIPMEERRAIVTAAWFLYTGFVVDYKKHVLKSIEIASENLQATSIDADIKERVLGLINGAWSMDETDDLGTKVLRDALTAYYGSEDFLELIELHRLEIQEFGDANPSEEEWWEEHLIRLHTDHRYHSEIAIEKWDRQKRANVMRLISENVKAGKKRKKEKLKVRLKNESPERAIQSLYRTQLRNHIKLSDIADTKANILLSVNAIIISLLLANLIPSLDNPNNSYLIYPTVIFVTCSILSMIMSVLATRPKIENKELIGTSLKPSETNYLFFGNFYHMELVDFKNKIGKIIESKESIYDSLTTDLYFLGKVLQKKYKLLRWTYTVFIVGIVFSVIAFAIALKYYGMDQEIIDAVAPKAQP